MSAVKANIHRALSDQQLGQAVLNACLLSVEKRDKIISELDDFQALRSQARAIRLRSLDDNQTLHARFRETFEAAGGRLHYAAGADVACRIVVDILRKAGARRGVKAKSMVTEEIELGSALAYAGIDAIESDLGEFIVQLAGEKPSHITAPALHKSRESIGRLFSEKLRVPYTSDPAELTGIAREYMRHRYLNAEFGISGGNFIIAETGHVVVVENEGNGRLGSSLPRIFIVVTGLEKVLENLSDLPPLLSLLPRSATGQRITSYINMMLPAHKGEDGPEEFHLVMLDNGRSRAMLDADFREMLLCIRCGACLNICPVYRSVGGHAYGSVYPGPMGAVLSNLLGSDAQKYYELPFLSTLCGACREVCPVDIDIPRLLLKLRAVAPKPALEKLAAGGWGWAVSTPARFELMGGISKFGLRLFGRSAPGGLGGSKGTSFRRSR